MNSPKVQIKKNNLKNLKNLKLYKLDINQQSEKFLLRNVLIVFLKWLLISYLPEHKKTKFDD